LAWKEIERLRLRELSQLKARLANARRKIDADIAHAKVIATKGVSVKKEIELATNDHDLYSKVAITLASIGEQRQADAQTQIEQLVTRGLTTIFGEEISFHLVQTQRGKTPEVKFLVKSQGAVGQTIETSVMDSRGGGLAAVVGFLLRLVIMLLRTGRNNRVLILDESFSHVSAEYERPLAEFLKELVDKTDVQIILVTHSDAFSEFADKRYRLTTVAGATEAKEF
jgi:DNA repair exonuclease SbcCD ATPase subunit